MLCNGLDFQLGGQQQLRSQPHPLLQDELCQRLPRFLFEFGRKIAGVAAQHGGDGAQTQGLRQMLAHIQHGGLYQLGMTVCAVVLHQQAVLVGYFRHQRLYGPCVGQPFDAFCIGS